jgi:hypothetical protein
MYLLGRTAYNVLSFYESTSNANTEILIKTGIVWQSSTL